VVSRVWVGGGAEGDGSVGGNDEEHAVVVGPGERRSAQVVQTHYQEVGTLGTYHRPNTQL